MAHKTSTQVIKDECTVKQISISSILCQKNPPRVSFEFFFVFFAQINQATVKKKKKSHQVINKKVIKQLK